jgi:cytochrome c2
MISALHRIWSFRFGSKPWGTPLLMAWNLVAVLVVLLAPAQLIHGEAFWSGSLPGAGLSLVMAAAFLAVALVLAAESRGFRGVRPVAALVGAGLCYAGALALLLLRPDIRATPAECLVSAALGVVLAVTPYVLFRYRRTLVSLLVLGLAVALRAGLASSDAASSSPDGPQQRTINSSFMMLSITVHPGLIETPVMDGGGVDTLGDSLLLVTGDGVFYVIRPTSDGTQLTSRRLAGPPPLDRKAFLADQPSPERAPRFRVTDVLLERGAADPRVFVAHQHWNSPKRCFTLRVSVAALQDLERPGEPAGRPWTSLFETWPCITALPGNDDQTGGRLEWLGDNLLLTVGDHGFDGRNSPAYSQTTDNAYGKVMLIDQAGGHELFTIGHRNPQGLLVDRNKQIWITEHGPQGGDEINRLEKGRNYGWPFVTYGTDYGRRYWPLSQGAYDHGTYTEPVHAFVPSIGISNLIQVRSDLFPEWRGDFLVSSMRTKRLHRLRIRGDRVAYVEVLSVGREVRDLVEGPGGRVFVWSDEADIVVVAPGRQTNDGGALFERCRACHEGTGPSVAPSLSGIVGRRVAATAGFRYSPALASLGGDWTEARLDAYLADPGVFAPGSPMEQGRVPEPDERRALIEFLKNYK